MCVCVNKTLQNTIWETDLDGTVPILLLHEGLGLIKSASSSTDLNCCSRKKSELIIFIGIP